MTRTWEIDDNRSMPSDLVREQDFILRVRRLQRLGPPHLVADLILNAIEPLAKSGLAIEAVQESLKEFAKVTNGFYAEMSNGDAFLIWESAADAQQLTRQLISVLMPADQKIADASKFLLFYKLPAD